MQVKQFRYATDNFSYLIFGDRSALVIDGGAVDEILGFIRDRSLQLETITNTHGHPDHTAGNKSLRDRSGALLMDHRTLAENKPIQMEGARIQVFHTPGHTADSVCFLLDDLLITGDTLFNGTIGNCFSGDHEAFLRSIKKLMSFPVKTRVYAGHDYVRDALKFARYLEPDNRHIDLFLENYHPDHVYSTLGQELDMNPYLRFNEKNLVLFLENRGLPVGTEYQRWESLMSIE
ncbi:MAG: MBL fold metallo-hydrolase [Desulfobacterales bacterium]|nr:MBL fold metallo-hydrolase [Desulfobacterales bacterium]